MREPDKSGRVWLVCPACGNRLAEVDESGLLWGRSWTEDGRTLRFARTKNLPLMTADAVVMGYRHPDAVDAVCPGRQGGGCGEAVTLD